MLEDLNVTPRLIEIEADLVAGRVTSAELVTLYEARIARLKAKSARRLRDLNHKITCGIVRECEQAGVTELVLSQPTGIAEAPGRKAQRQRNGSWEHGEQARQNEYKAEGKFAVTRDGERGSSSTCPACLRPPEMRGAPLPLCGLRLDGPP